MTRSYRGVPLSGQSVALPPGPGPPGRARAASVPLSAPADKDDDARMGGIKKGADEPLRVRRFEPEPVAPGTNLSRPGPG
jgi:hypothetical protein